MVVWCQDSKIDVVDPSLLSITARYRTSPLFFAEEVPRLSFWVVNLLPWWRGVPSDWNNYSKSPQVEIEIIMFLKRWNGAGWKPTKKMMKKGAWRFHHSEHCNTIQRISAVFPKLFQWFSYCFLSSLLFGRFSCLFNDFSQFVSRCFKLSHGFSMVLPVFPTCLVLLEMLHALLAVLPKLVAGPGVVAAGAHLIGSTTGGHLTGRRGMLKTGLWFTYRNHVDVPWCLGSNLVMFGE